MQWSNFETRISTLRRALAGRSAQLQLVDGDFLQGQADARHLRVVQVPAHRGMITDRVPYSQYKAMYERIAAGDRELIGLIFQWD